MAMSVSMILAMYVILCVLSYDFNKLTYIYMNIALRRFLHNHVNKLPILYIHVHINVFENCFKKTACM